VDSAPSAGSHVESETPEVAVAPDEDETGHSSADGAETGGETDGAERPGSGDPAGRDAATRDGRPPRTAEDHGDDRVDGDDSDDAVSPWRPPEGISPSRTDPERIGRIRRYYGLRDAGDLAVVFEVREGVVAPEVVVAHLAERLEAAGIPARALRGDPERARSLLIVTVRGDAAASEINAYGRVRLTLRYRTAPGRTVAEEVEVAGPFRLSRVSSADAAVNSLYAVDPTVYRRVLGALDRGWQRRVASEGLLYRVASLPDGAARDDALRVLDHLGVRNGGGQWAFFDTPPMIAGELQRILDGSGYGFSLDPLTGEIRIVYNGNT